MKQSVLISLLVGVIVLFLAGFLLLRYLRRWKKDKENEKKEDDESKKMVKLVQPVHYSYSPIRTYPTYLSSGYGRYGRRYGYRF